MAPCGGPSGVMTRDRKTMLLSKGMRTYVANLIAKVIADCRAPRSL